MTPPDADQLSAVISHATAPAFLLGAVGGFVAILMGRINGILDRSRALTMIADDDRGRAALKLDLPRLKQRAVLINQAIYYAVASAICTSLLVILAFTATYLGFRHEYGAGIMFVAALGLMTVSLVYLAREVRIALTDDDHRG